MNYNNNYNNNNNNYNNNNNNMNNQTQDAGQQPLQMGQTLEYNEPEFITLKPGVYNFKFNDYKISKYAGNGEKTPPCDMVTVTLQVNTDEGVGLVTENFFMYQRVAWKVAGFLASLGMFDNNGNVILDFDKALNRTGQAKISNREYNGNTYNQVDRFISAKNKKVKQSTGGYDDLLG